MKKVLLGVLIVLLLIQFVRPKKNDSGELTNDYTTSLQVSDQVKEIIKTSCADCHSNMTNYPWYSEIAPISWYLAQHINEGKDHLNFSEWTAYNKKQKRHIIEEFEEELENQGMPMKSYLLIHKDAKLTDSEYKLLLDWVKSLKVE